MNIENTKKLLEKYPKIFSQHKLSPKETAMCWGFECGDGWYWLINNLCDSIQCYIDSNNKPQVEAIQVKEKYGVLNFYADNLDGYTFGVIGFAEDISGKICEACGSIKDVKQTEGWIMTRCKKCLEL